MSNKTIAIMQPYFLPYVGYYQLAAAVDRFIFLDDVNFIKKGWINRNRILSDDEPLTFSIPLSGASQNKKINEIDLAIDDRWQRKFLASIDRSYSKAANFETTKSFLVKLLENRDQGIAGLAKRSVVEVAKLVNIETEFVDSSSAYNNVELTGQDRIIDICCQENTSVYANPPNGRELYESHRFNEKNMQLVFAEPSLEPYDQKTENFVPGLSILDVLMFNSIEQTRNLILQGQLIP